MKKLLIITLFAIFGCAPTTENEVVVASCPTEDLGLTIANKNPLYATKFKPALAAGRS